MHHSIYRSAQISIPLACVALITIFFLAAPCYAQEPAPRSLDTTAVNLPDAPQPQGEAAPEIEAGSFDTTPTRVRRFAPKPKAPLYNKYIEPSQSAQPLLGFQRKLAFGADQILSPYFPLAVVSSAAYEHVIDSSPNYGTDKGAFGQRIGAAAIRNASDSIFTDGLMPAVFHQDPRFYLMGKGHSVPARGVHAVLRVFVTRSDSGKPQANYSLFAGHAATAALANAYYPDDNRGASETAENFAGSLAGTALSNAVREFLPDLLHLAHLE